MVLELPGRWSKHFQLSPVRGPQEVIMMEEIPRTEEEEEEEEEIQEVGGYFQYPIVYCQWNIDYWNEILLDCLLTMSSNKPFF